MYRGVSTDTRRLSPGELFVALRGERFDGADFVSAAAEAGAAGAVVEREPRDVPSDFELFVVDDALIALGRLARARRRELGPAVVAITGTTGKTTTKALLAAVLSERAFSSPGNYNNLVGAPLSLLEAPAEKEIWVLELASNQRGEIEKLGRITEPDHGVITSVSEGHLEGLGNLSGVLDEKLSLLDAVRPGGRVLVAEDPPELVEAARARYPGVLSVGFGAEADERAEECSVTADGVRWTWRGVDFRLPGYGVHLVHDALFAVAMAGSLGVEPGEAAARLSGAAIPPMRGEVRRLGELTLLVDCYNANPSSFRAGLDALDGMAEGRRRAVLIGTMLELGDQTGPLHARVAEMIVEAGVELIAATGEFATAFSERAEELGERLITSPELDGAYEALAARLIGDEAVLIKASRGMKFERAIPLFEHDFG